MTLERFLRERGGSWEELSELVAAAKGKPERLGADGVRRLGTLYRGAAADLALARRRFPRDPARARLERLVATAGLIVYEGRARRRSLWRFVATEYWQAVAERPAWIAVSAVALFGPALLAGVWAASDPAGAQALIPSEFEAATDPPSDAGASAAQRAVFTSELFTNNIQVTFLAFAAGIAVAIGTGVLLAYNGVLLGAIAGAAIEAGNGGAFLEFVIPHGPLELTCIVVTGAAGMRIGWAIVDPGHRPRREALVVEARQSIGIVLGTMPWLVVAGISEAFVRSAGLPSAVLISTGTGLFALYWLLVAWRGRAVPRAVEAGAPGSALKGAPAT